MAAADHLCSLKMMPCIILHDLSLLSSFIMSHPLYFSYFLFFYPYFIKLISFLSPLFVATTLLSLLLTTTTAFCPKLPQSKLLILPALISQLKSNLDHVTANQEEESNFEDFEIYKIVFHGTSFMKNIGNEEDDRLEEEGKQVSLTETIPEYPVHAGRRYDVTAINPASDKAKEELGLQRLFQELDRFENSTTPIETSADFYKVIGELRKEEPAPVKIAGSGSEAEAINSSDNNKIIQSLGRDGVLKVDKSSSWRSNSSRSLCSHGSMREEKEWRRTLACKLFEERHNSMGGVEGMDSLWEAYENDNSKNRKETMLKNNNNNKVMMMMTVKNKNNGGGIKSTTDDEDEDDEEEEEEMSNGHLCCLQALKLSTGKMNLGMGKPNLVKFSKALKGFGWFHHVRRKPGKKS